MSHRPNSSGDYMGSPPNHRYSHLEENRSSPAQYDVADERNAQSQPLRQGISPLHSPSAYPDQFQHHQNPPYPPHNQSYPDHNQYHNQNQPYPPPSGPGHNVGYEDSPDPNASTVWSAYDKVDPDHYDGVEFKSKLYDAEAETEGDGMIVREKKGTKKVHATEVIATTRARRWWIRITWSLTWWVPSFLLIKIGGLKRQDVRMAWREKLAIFMMIILSCCIVLFYIIFFGRLLCPDSDKAWNTSELATHQGEDDYMAAIAGKVYDFTKFYKGQHSDFQGYTTSADVMLQFAGQDLTNYFPMPMTVACPGLVTNEDLSLLKSNFTPIVAYAVHTSGKQQTITGTKLDADDWYTNRLTPDLKQYYKGSYVFDKGTIENGANSDSKQWAIYNKKLYDLSDYLYTVQYYSGSSGTDFPNYSFINDGISGLFQSSSGQDITKAMNEVLAKMSSEDVANNLKCLDNAFYVGELDFRKEPKCLVQNYLLLAFSIIIMATIGAKFLAALQLGSKRQPELLDKFVICQVPCYTEGEESLKKTIDSLAALKYDDKRKLIFIICDGNIIGSGNNRPTPRIVLDLLGVDPKLDPEPLLFKSIGEGSKQLNYGKVYSGLYEFEGHVVPYVVVVKVGKPSETSKPGNRGKRDSQVLLMQYLNRVHFEAPMSPLELEIYHQMRNVIGIDPAFYEYIFQVDADTTVTPDSLNRLISCTSDDQKIIGICGETKVANEKESLTTMIQVYEYYISHHLTKAFESLFGSVTCLPGCFSVYRIRTADKGRPVIISSIVIDEYAEPNVDTLHKKNLFSLGEDRYLTTLMMKHFPTFKMKFTPDAVAHTVAPSRWNVLLSQRRRWINSTIHNLAELLFLPEMCGFCLFGMRWIVFLDLLGTIILPATCVYLVYLIVVVSTHKAAVPVISLAMIGAVYGLQALIFIIKREFMLVGWMVVYILAFPIYSVFLPLYSFWSMDDFSWGNTRKVVGEGNQKTVVYEDDEPFNEEYEANAWETASLHSEKSRVTSHTSVSRNLHPYPISNRAPSFHSSTSELPPGADYWRDSSPLGPQHSSRNLRHAESNPSLRAGFTPRDRVQSMAGMSMWGNGSNVNFDQSGMQNPMNPTYTGGSFMDNGSMRGSFYPPQMGMMNPMMGPGMGSGMGMMSPMQGHMSPLHTGSQHGGHMNMGMGMGMGMMGMGAPRNTIMSNLGGGGGGSGYPQQQQSRMSSYSLATTANPLGPSGESGRDPLAGLNVDERSEVEDQDVLDKLKAWLSKQDLMNV
uniref:chitin synthase n=1 Tax=Kwoniella dejecticola CBS 10117 TaxID=1296121 RepID=A0A1A6ADW1_9TREE|nr:chitin synthase [Kwoniella dejecticola CBS 10117]OBR88250.1 chitin synthase [Kwoniella dejecticola CBS 10117]